ncbi:hypothetical protein MHZ92_04305 [Sporosarcina sp. ACRSL]|uniref:hypothetical protein n=1 Tax=Sporosarcina sp. ACRSL TaxID=2918215 RepID=UPI001EF54E3A|nr:hypothetical protein [Sporosarcina sp. ACRSL]MCG7343340.1 hypothetical protein [Sporosarcina sp. ACRSL]
MMHHGFCGDRLLPMQQLPPVVCPTQVRCTDSFFPVQQPVIHPIVNVNRIHPVVTPRHYFTETFRNVPGAPIYNPGPGAGFGPGFGPGFGRRGFY